MLQVSADHLLVLAHWGESPRTPTAPTSRGGESFLSANCAIRATPSPSNAACRPPKTCLRRPSCGGPTISGAKALGRPGAPRLLSAAPPNDWRSNAQVRHLAVAAHALRRPNCSSPLPGPPQGVAPRPWVAVFGRNAWWSRMCGSGTRALAERRASAERLMLASGRLRAMNPKPVAAPAGAPRPADRQPDGSTARPTPGHPGGLTSPDARMYPPKCGVHDPSARPGWPAARARPGGKRGGVPPSRCRTSPRRPVRPHSKRL